jgi:glycosyltransferase 2 family protein
LRSGWRLGICGLLMFWILHSIFLNEGRLALERQGIGWTALSRVEQWRAAWSSGPRELWHTITLVDRPAWMLSLVFMGSTIGLGVFRWRMVLRVHGLDLSLGRAAGISFVAHFFNSFLLGSTGGDLLKAYYAARETHHKKTEAVVTVVVDRLLGLFATLMFGCLMMAPNLSLLQSQKRFAALAGFILLMTVGCGAVISLSFWGGLSRLWPGSRAWLRKLPKGELLEQCLDACRVFGRHRGLIPRTLGISILVNVACVMQFVTLAHGLNLNVPTLALFVIVPMIVCVSALPITPSGLGVRENLYVLMLAAPGIEVAATPALSLSLLAYAGSLFWSLIGGVVYACLKERQHLAEVTQRDAAGAS